jgi:hypothetical protein
LCRLNPLRSLVPRGDTLGGRHPISSDRLVTQVQEAGGEAERRAGARACGSGAPGEVPGYHSEAYELLHKVPPEDRVKDFLTIYIAQRDRVAPPDWNGVIVLSDKR